MEGAGGSGQGYGKVPIPKAPAGLLGAARTHSQHATSCRHRTTLRYSPMDQIIPRAWMQTSMAVCGLLALAACSPLSTQDQEASTAHAAVVLSITDLTGGSIKGAVKCTDEAGRALMSYECFPSEYTLQRTIFSCGPSIATIDQSWTHNTYVTFPANWGPGKPSSLEVVRCIQSKVGFAFSATMGTTPMPGDNPEGDGTIFQSLHSTRP